MMIDKKTIVFGFILCTAGGAWNIWLKLWPFAAMFAFFFVSWLIFSIFAIRKEKNEKQMDKQHSEEFKRFKSELNNGYAYAYTDFGKERIDKLCDWEKSEFEDIVWNNYLKGSIKLAPLLPYLKKYDGVGKLKKDLTSPETPDTWKEEISIVLEQADKD